MQALLLGIALTLAGAAEDGTRYGQSAPPITQITIAPETPAPTLDESLLQTTPNAATDAAEPTIAEPAAAKPAEAAPLATAPAADTAGSQDKAASPQDKAAGAEDKAAGPPPPERSLVAAGPQPGDLMKALVAAPAAGNLHGVPMTLAEVVSDAPTRQDQTVRAKLYWDLAAALAEYYLAARDATELAALRQGVTNPGPGWEQKQLDVESRAQVARTLAEAAQLRLGRELGRPAGAMPLTVDVPHCGRYDARYDEVFVGRDDPIARHLSELITLRSSQLKTQARAVLEASDWLAEVSARRDPNSDGTGLLQAHDLLSLRRRAFVATVRDYNQEIATYTELAAPNRVGTDRLVAMMIRTSTTVDEVPWRRPAVAQAAAEGEPDKTVQPAGGAEAQQAGQSDNSGRHTFRKPRTEERRFRPFRNRERSILRFIQRLGDQN